MSSDYKPNKQFFEMNIEELQEYVNHYKKIDKKRKWKKKGGNKTRSKRLRKTKKRILKFTRRKKKT